MATLVCFHAHPDDEAITTGGVMARAAAEGHRVVLVVATRGEHGEVAEGFLDPDEPLERRRERETEAAAAILGVSRVAFLGYTDSGMMGTDTNAAPASFWQADLDEAAGRLAAILSEEGADVLTVYDDNGGYGHPDHIQVHRVGVRAAALAGTPEVYEATMNRDELATLLAEARARGLVLDALDADGDEAAAEVEHGVPSAQLTTCVDVTPWLGTKRDAMRAHASQIAESSFFLAMPDDAFAATFGREWFIRRGTPVPVAERESWLAGLS